MKKWWILLFFGLTTYSKVYSASISPTVFLVTVVGNAEYSPDGQIWKPRSGKRFLVEGDRLRTGDDGIVHVLNLKTHTLLQLEKNSAIQIIKEDVSKLSGELTQREVLSGKENELRPLFPQFAIPLTVPAPSSIKINLIDTVDLVLDEEHPDIVWPNPGDDYSYKIQIESTTYVVPGSSKDLIRFKPPQQPGRELEYFIMVYEDAQLLFSTEKRKLRWLSIKEQKEQAPQNFSLIKLDPSGILLANELESKGLLIGAMDHYRKFLKEFPGENEIRLLLIHLYDQLRFGALRDEELEEYNKIKYQE